MEDESPRLVYDADGGSVMLQTNGPAVTVDGIEGEVVFERSTAEGERAFALWLEQGQADVLAKMIGYILEKVPIRPESQQTLRDIKPLVESLLERHGNG